MAGKTGKSGKHPAEAHQVFRQFAWNLAGTLASAKAGTRPARAGGSGKR